VKSAVAPKAATAMPAAVAAPSRLAFFPTCLLLAGVAAVSAGLLWDFSWESTIGADPFWAPAHATMHIGTILAGLAALMFVRKSGSPNETIRLWNFRAPFGAWLTLWSALLVLTATWFDKWWQSAYGLNSEATPPPQPLSAAGSIGLLLGALTLITSKQNAGPPSRLFAGLVIAVAALLLMQVWTMTITSNYPNQQHSASFYQRSCAFYPLILAAVTRPEKCRWSATRTALLYLFVVCLFVWTLPLVPARPLTPPIYNDLKSMMPPPFPLLLVVPAFFLDLLLRRANRRNGWWLSIVAGGGFFASFLLVQWPFAKFLVTSAADNWFFAGGGKNWPFFINIEISARTTFWETQQNPLNLSAAGLATVIAIGSARLGLWCGDWFAKLRR
jgi:hypothetical protein